MVDMLLLETLLLEWRVATTADLVSAGVDRQLIYLIAQTGRIRRVRKGLWAARDTDPAICLALSLGGRLACVSASRYWAGIGSIAGEQIHVSVARSASRLESRRGETVIHWSRMTLAGDDFAVALDVAREQMTRCAPHERYP
jgi:hypothetical protein